MVRSIAARLPYRGSNDSWASVLSSCELRDFPEWPEVWSQCRRRLHRWCVPPNWSVADWFDETQALGLASACQALRDFDPTRNVPRAAFVRQRILAASRTRYRQEWAFALHCSFGSSVSPLGTLAIAEADSLALDEEAVLVALSRLTETDRQLITHLFWDGWTQAAVAEAQGISQAAVSKRKQMTLRKLGCLIRGLEK